MKPPIVIVAPARRCGTTLLQRALNSTGSTIIYGENFVFLETYPAIVAGSREHLEVKLKNTSTARERVLQGDYDFDASMLFPDYETYVRLLRGNLDRIYRYYEDASLSYGYERWGLKHQIRQAARFLDFFRIYPDATYVFIYRGIVDVARSEKARFGREYPRPQNWAVFGETWSRNLETMRRIERPNVLHLEYAEVEAQPEATRLRLEAFCGVSGIDPAVFGRRVNVTPVLDRLTEAERDAGYRAPVALTDAEQAALMSRAAATCEKYGYPASP